MYSLTGEECLSNVSGMSLFTQQEHKCRCFGQFCFCNGNRDAEVVERLTNPIYIKVRFNLIFN